MSRRSPPLLLALLFTSACNSTGGPRPPAPVVAADEARARRGPAHEAAVAKARAALVELVPRFLFTLATSIPPGRRYDDPEPSRELAVKHDGTRLLTRGRLQTSLWEVTARGPLDEVRRIVGDAIYDEARGRYDKEALAVLLDAAYVSPDTPLLGRTAREVYPFFRPFVRAQARLHRVVDEQRSAMGQHEAALGLGQAEYPPEREVVLTADGSEVNEAFFRGDIEMYFGEPAEDRRHFYRAATLALALDEKAGMRRSAFDYLDVGFWLRRFEDGTAPVLAELLTRVLEDYDPEYLEALRAPPRPKQVKPPAPQVAGLGPLAGDRVLAIDAPWLAADFDDDGTSITVVTSSELLRLSRADGTPLLRAPLPRPEYTWELQPYRVAFSADGKKVVVAYRDLYSYRAGPSVVLDRHSGTQLAKLDDIGSTQRLSLTRNGNIVAAQKEADVVVRALPSPGMVSQSLRRSKATRLIGLHPDRPLLLTSRKTTLTLWHLFTGEALSTVELRAPVGSVATSPDGHTWLLAHADGASLFELDEEAGTLVLRANLEGPSYPRGVFDRSGQVLALQALDGTTQLLDAKTGQPREGRVFGDAPLAVDSEGRLVILQGTTDGEVLLYAW